MNADQQNNVDFLQQRISQLESALRAASHDLRSPLMTIQGFSQELLSSLRELKDLLQQSTTAPHNDRIGEIVVHEIPEAVQFICDGAAKLETLINSLSKNL
jgi:signal transduction histidine kinase